MKNICLERIEVINLKKSVCEYCMDFVEYNIKEEETSICVKGKKYKYMEKHCYCNICNNEINVNEVMDENIKSIDEVYRKNENIISVSDIKEILKKYHIGKRPLSLLLGWGEVTITRYIDGDMPTKLYSDELKKILINHNYLLELLNKNKSKITEKTYNYVLEAIKNKVNYHYEKIELIAEYIINYYEKSITPLALQKLLYYVQGFSKVFLGKFMFNDDCEAWIHGPVYSSIYNIYKVNGKNEIDSDENFIADCFINEDEKLLLDVVIQSFGFYNAKALEKMTHIENPWINARKEIADEIPSNVVITKESIEEYFILVKNKYNMINISDIKDYSKKQFENIN
ncbi:MAG: DUF4065 domain-containing protein [Clostridia bacterium]